MAQRDVLERIDDHMARGNELMAQIIELHDGTRQFTSDLLRRHEIVIREITREMHEVRSEFKAGRTVLVDLHEESVAQRQAILTLIDELRSRGFGGRN